MEAQQVDRVRHSAKPGSPRAAGRSWGIISAAVRSGAASLRGAVSRRAVGLPLALMASAALIWGASLQSVDPRQMNDFGLPSVFSPLMYLALGLLTVSFCLTLQRRDAPAPILLAHLILLIVLIHGTPALVYGTLRYSWAWKHVGIVDFILRHGRVDPEIATLSAYHNWPGFFALSAFLTDVAGLSSPLTMAIWAPVFFNLLDLGALLFLFSAVTLDRRLRWLAAWLFFITNWVGQDYFAPQALNYFLHLITLGICLRWLDGSGAPGDAALRRWLRYDWAMGAYRRIVGHANADRPAAVALPRRARAGLIALVLVMFLVVASSHQLTPWITVGSVALLVVFGLCSARALPFMMAGVLLAWLVIGAGPYMRGEIASTLESLGQLDQNFSSNLVDLSRVTEGQRWVAVMGRGLTAAVAVLAVAGGLRRLRAGYWDVPLALLVLAPLTTIGGSSYGGEIVFRVYLFALPFLALFMAAVIYPRPAAGRAGWTWAATAGLSLLLLVGFVFAYYGKDRQYYFTPAEVEAAEFLYGSAPPDSLLIEGARNYPSQFRNYEHFTYVPISNESDEVRSEILSQPVAVFARWLDNDRYAATYLIITRGQTAQLEALGLMPVGSMDEIERELRRSGRFDVIYSNADAAIFTLAGAGQAP